MKGPLFYAKILLFGEYGIIKDSKGLAIPYNSYQGSLIISDDNSDKALESNDKLRAFYKYLEDLNDEDVSLRLEEMKRDIERNMHFDSSIATAGGSDGGNDDPGNVLIAGSTVYDNASDADKQAFQALLALPDPELVGYLLNNQTPDPALQRVVAARAVDDVAAAQSSNRQGDCESAGLVEGVRRIETAIARPAVAKVPTPASNTCCISNRQISEINLIGTVARIRKVCHR